MKPTAYSLQPTVGGLRAAFTLIEVLVAMTVLSIMILLVANIFQGSSAAWNIGTQKADMNTSARAALDYMARELASAVAGPIEAANPPALSAISFLLTGGNDIRFVALSGDPADGRALRGINFRRESMSLQYERFTNDFNPYTGTWNGGSGLQPLITNVWSLKIIAFTNEYGLTNGLLTENFDSSVSANSNQLPICVDIALEMLSDDDMARAGAGGAEFVARNSKLYSTRVYFPNRRGYGAR